LEKGIWLVFKTKNEWAKVSIFDSLGQEIQVLANCQFSEGEHQLTFESRGLPAGNYYSRIITNDRQKAKIMVKA